MSWKCHCLTIFLPFCVLKIPLFDHFAKNGQTPAFPPQVGAQFPRPDILLEDWGAAAGRGASLVFTSFFRPIQIQTARQHRIDSSSEGALSMEPVRRKVALQSGLFGDMLLDAGRGQPPKLQR